MLHKKYHFFREKNKYIQCAYVCGIKVFLHLDFKGINERCSKAEVACSYTAGMS